jgi:hypothetical protein
LDRARLVEFRRGVFRILQILRSSDDPRRRDLLARFFGFPANLPRLRSLRPPEGNSRQPGIAQSWYELASRGQLPDVY